DIDDQQTGVLRSPCSFHENHFLSSTGTFTNDPIRATRSLYREEGTLFVRIILGRIAYLVQVATSRLSIGVGKRGVMRTGPSHSRIREISTASCSWASGGTASRNSVTISPSLRCAQPPTI